jgi:hypothetical protein
LQNLGWVGGICPLTQSGLYVIKETKLGGHPYARQCS